jgi:hypothetical protein
MRPTDVEAIRAKLLELAERRGAKTFCPSEAARELADDWRPLMPLVRQVSADLVQQRLLKCTRRGKPCDPLAAGGPIRIAAASESSGSAG